MKQDFKVYARLLSYLKPYWGAALLVLVGFGINASTEVSVAKLLEYIINAIQHQNQQNLNWFPFLVIILIFFRGLGLFIGGYYTAVISRSLIFQIRQEVFAKLLRLPAQYYLDNNSGQITAKIMYNVEQLTAASSESLKTLVQYGFITLGLIGYLLYTNWRLTICILIFAPLIGLLIRKAAKRMRKLSVQVQNTMGDINHVVQESVNGNAVVKGFGGETFEQERFYHHSNENLKRGLKMVIVQQMNSPIVQLIMAIAMSIIIWIALRPQVLGNTSAGEFVAYITAAGLLAKPIKSLTDINEKLQRGMAAAYSVFELLDMPEEKNTGDLKPVLKGNIEFNQVNLTYSDGSQAIYDFSLNVKAGETVALVGRSGAGKSSLVNLLVRFQEISSGKILLDGFDIQKIELTALRSQIAMVNQQVVLFNRSVRDNIAYGQLQGASEAEIIAAAKAAYAHDFIMSLPQGYDTILGAQGLNLSGGQRQRIAIARAILKNAPILILDEATSALDNESEHFIQKAFDKAMQERTTIVIAHRLSTIENADRIVVMDKGRIVEQGNHQELMQKHGAYYQLHQRNFEEN
ncbi:lipid A export permease/ATP-binding protein MsbA [Acinetobacter radioresistens]|uniref:Lipid A export permease/ATP-binding protein MsbA n=2 Tax=Acinetobacter radioresistens TaxID=40216 RepID=A0A2T1J0Z2_ACIRA|nr:MULTISPECIES: lipid A export permease/ATP-binding protein MsbA [Acinetobacter]EET81731.1 lipid A export permease/ATP-binding protein MsbA [Acinetobacter radioresistens SK82]EEY87612.1 lipid A export permease/ATP-binding protein MsbA [Acinetobacter radioresistens SH164]ENV87937.1 lipid A export ATP-binding/permease MsbA [Acinetobacter radioresistens NIPH 2130]ENV88827.1 lipid A export ATP-binding/permease MsbA [Acinetobacter radioresistens DSM 6976 = NBRC 102413 = CIP 103788]EXB35179.1 lipid